MTRGIVVADTLFIRGTQLGMPLQITTIPLQKSLCNLQFATSRQYQYQWVLCQIDQVPVVRRVSCLSWH